MIRKDFYLREDQIQFLKSLPGQDSEYIRLALDEYIKKFKNESVSASQSKKGGK